MELEEAGAGGFSESQRRAIAQVGQACASLSFVGSAVIVVANFRFKQLVVWLAVCDIGINISFFLGSPNDGEGLCYTQAIVQQFFQVALMIWTLLISQSLLVMASTTRAFDGNKRMPWNHLWAWGLSTVLTIGPLCTHSLGETETSVCWIKTNHPWDVGALWRGLFLLVVFLSMVSIVWTYVSVVNHLGRAQRSIVLLSSHSSSSPSRRIGRNKDDNSDQSPGRPIIVKTNQIREERGTAAKPSSTLRSLLGTPAPRQIDESGLDETTVVSIPGFRGQYSKLGTPQRKKFSVRHGRSCSDNHFRAGTRGGVVSEGACSMETEARDYAMDGLFVRGIHSRSFSEGHRSVERSQPPSLGYRNSQVHSREWLWSTSKEAGFVVEKDDVFERGDRESREESLSRSSLAATRTASPERISPPDPLPPLPEAGLGASRAFSRGGETRNDATGRGNNRRVPQPTPWVNANRKVATVMVAPKLSAVFCADETSFNLAAVASRGDIGGVATEALAHGNGDVSRTASSRRAKPSDRIGHVITPQRPRRSRIVDGAGKARGFVRRMSSLDIENPPGGCGNDTGGEGVYWGSVGSEAGQRDSRPRSAVKGEWDSSRSLSRRARAGDMEKFISRVKWYPVIYVLCWVFTLLNGLEIIVVTPANASLSLVLLATVTARLQGLLNFLWYGLNDRLKQAWYQDFLYRRAVASCCRALWCCCSCPCLPDDGDDKDVGNFREDAPKRSERVSAAESMEGGAGAGSMRTAAFYAPAYGNPALTKADQAQLSTPSCSVDASFLAPRRPTRPCRKMVGSSGSTDNSALSLDLSGVAEGSATRAQQQEKERPNARPSAAASDQREQNPVVTPQYHRPPADGTTPGEHKSALSPTLPISVSMPVVSTGNEPSSTICARNGTQASCSSWFFFDDSDGCVTPGLSANALREENSRQERL